MMYKSTEEKHPVLLKGIRVGKGAPVAGDNTCKNCDCRCKANEVWGVGYLQRTRGNLGSLWEAPQDTKIAPLCIAQIPSYELQSLAGCSILLDCASQPLLLLGGDT